MVRMAIFIGLLVATSARAEQPWRQECKGILRQDQGGSHSNSHRKGCVRSTARRRPRCWPCAHPVGFVGSMASSKAARTVASVPRSRASYRSDDDDLPRTVRCARTRRG